MPQYALFAKQSGEGCDYTIGCAQTLILLKGTNINDLDDEIREVVADHAFGQEERELEEFALVEVIRDLNVEDFMEEDEVDEEKEARRREYEKLKKEFG